MKRLSNKRLMFRNIAAAAIAQGIQDGVFGLEQGQNYGVSKHTATHMYYTSLFSVRCRVYVTNMSPGGEELQFHVNIDPGHFFSFWLRRRPGQVLLNSPYFVPMKSAPSIKAMLTQDEIPFEASHEPSYIHGF
jgi:hypothetical protein